MATALRRTSRFSWVLLLTFYLPFVSHQAEASHAVGTDISYECLGGNQYRFTLNFYRDCDGAIAPASIPLDITSASCNISTSTTLSKVSNQEVSQICPTQITNTTCASGTLPGVQQYVYTGIYTLPTECTDWIISYALCCRNGAITNLNNPSGERLYTQATIDNTGGNCNNSPNFTSLPSPYICVNQQFNYNHGAVDPDGDSLVYTLINPMSAPGTNISYVSGYSPTNPLSFSGSFTFDNLTGQMQFTPNLLQQAVISVLVEEYNTAGNLVGTTMRDLQIIVINCSNDPPTVSGVDSSTTQYNYDVCAGSTFCFDVFSSDLNGLDSTKLNWNNGISGATFTTIAGTFENGTFCWTPTLTDIGSHYFTVTVEDDACPIAGINSYTFEINVSLGTDPVISAGANQSACFGDSITLAGSAGAGAVYDWTPANGLSCTTCSSPSLQVLADGIYTMSVLYPGSGCVITDQVHVTMLPQPTVNVVPKSMTTCSGTPVSITANTDVTNSILWGPGGEITPTINPSPISSTNYIVTATNPSGCTNTDSAVVTINALPPAEVCHNIYVTTNGTGTGMSLPIQQTWLQHY